MSLLVPCAFGFEPVSGETLKLKDEALLLGTSSVGSVVLKLKVEAAVGVVREPKKDPVVVPEPKGAVGWMEEDSSATMSSRAVDALLEAWLKAARGGAFPVHDINKLIRIV